jgi:ferredoxin
VISYALKSPCLLPSHPALASHISIILIKTILYHPNTTAEPVTFTFIEGDAEFGERIEVTVTEEGHKLVDVALDNDVDIEAACGGELACSTCHCVFPKVSLILRFNGQFACGVLH